LKNTIVGFFFKKKLFQFKINEEEKTHSDCCVIVTEISPFCSTFLVIT